MNVERIIHIITGIFILLSFPLAAEDILARILLNKLDIRDGAC